jgi:hypothetical protein
MYELYACNRTEHKLLWRDSNPQAPAHRRYRSASLTPGRAGARLDQFNYRLSQIRSVFQFNSCNFVSSSRKLFDSPSIRFCNGDTGTVATNLTSDFEYLSCRVLAASATLASKSLFFPATSRSAIASATVCCSLNGVFEFVRLIDWMRSSRRVNTRSTSARSSDGSSAGSSPSWTLAERARRFLRSSIRFWQSLRSASASAIFRMSLLCSKFSAHSILRTMMHDRICNEGQSLCLSKNS